MLHENVLPAAAPHHAGRRTGDADTAAARIRPATAADAEACGRIIFAAFCGIADAHAFPRDFPSLESATQLAQSLIADPSIFGVVAEIGGRVIGSNFLSEGDPVRAVGPISVDPAVQGGGAGRRLMQAVVARAGGEAVRLVQDGFNTRSVALYASLGFEVKEPLLLVRGAPGKAPVGVTVRPMTGEDVSACAGLCMRVHGVPRTHELRAALSAFTPFVVEREGRIAGYLTAPAFWLMNHGVAETEADMRALVAGAAAVISEPISFLLPSRQASLLRWCLAEGMGVVKPMALMAMGEYQEPRGPWFPSVLY
jgi:predicted N-acetyltransferase YhbS